MTTKEGQRVVVVGGTSGMGLATVRATAALGASVVAAGRRPLAQREPIAGVEAAEVDVTDHESVEQLFRSVGELDHLLVTASPGKPGAFVDQDLATARSFHGRQVLRQLDLCQVRRSGLRSTGSITFVTGGAVVRPPAHGSMITATFAALEALTRALAIELGPRRVNAVRPGYTDSDMWSFLPPTERDELRRRVAEAMPVKRMGTPEDIADAVVFLMTNRQVTGTVLEVTGGETLVDSLDDVP